MLGNFQIIYRKGAAKRHHHKTAYGEQGRGSKPNAIIFFSNGMKQMCKSRFILLHCQMRGEWL